jgi:hypothetical protein
MLRSFEERRTNPRIALALVAICLGCDAIYEVEGLVRGSDCAGGEVAPLAAVNVSALAGRKARASAQTDAAGQYRLSFVGSPIFDGFRLRYARPGYRGFEIDGDRAERTSCDGRPCLRLDVLLECATENRPRADGTPPPIAPHRAARRSSRWN